MLLSIFINLLFLALATSFPLTKRAVLPPTQDPFYVPPSGFANHRPGTILRQRAIADASAAYGRFGANITAAYQLLYRSTNAIGKPAVAVTTLFVPKNPHPTRHVAYQTAYDASYNDCAPSSNLQFFSGNQSSIFADFLAIAALIDRGFFVSTTDYEGLRAAYTAGPQAAYATLDSVRAVLNSHTFSGIAASGVENALWGYSGGALASEWAAEFQPSYAPEVKFIAAALGGLTPNLTSVYNTVNGHVAAGLAPPAIIGLGRAYHNLSNFVHAHLVPNTSATFLAAGRQCYSKNTPEFAFQNITKYFTVDPFTSPVVQSVLNVAGYMGLHHTPAIPLFVYKALGDEVSPIADTDALVAKYCAKGLDIMYRRNVYGGHAVEGNLGAPGAFEYLLNRFNGVQLESGCHTVMVNKSSFGPSDYAALGQNITAELAVLTQGLDGL